MKILIVDDDSTNRLLLQETLQSYGQIHLAANGKEAIEAVREALRFGAPYDLICLDIMMPGVDGQKALEVIRALESARGVVSTHGAKIVMITALGDMKSACTAFGGLCDAYLVKPVQRNELIENLRRLALIE